MKTYLKTLGKNSPNVAKEIDIQEVQEAHRVTKKLYPRKHTPRHIIITLAKMKQKERLLETAREKDTVTYKRVPIRLSANFSKETLQARSHERQGPTSQTTVSRKAII